MHSVVTGPDGTEGEFKLRGAARAERDPDRQTRYIETVSKQLGWTPEIGRFHLWEIELDDLVFISYDVATGDQHVAMWPPGREYIRRATSATSLGEPEPLSDLIQAESR